VATARETLLDEIVALVQASPSEALEAQVNDVMLRYRVQTKPGIKVEDGQTARDALALRLVALWRERGLDAKDEMGTTIDQFRMQTKGKTKPVAKSADKKSGRPQKASDDDDDDGDGAALAPPAFSRSHAPISADDPPVYIAPQPRAIAVAGGPRRRGKTRSECPKCHSMGVVLARSYAGDEYFSCIYCGWQAYKPVDENDPTASLASRLLGQSSGEG
jgi:hypothetical protein